MATTDFALLHGGGQGSWVWSELVDAMTTVSDGGIECITLDVPGCGAKRERDTSGIEFDDLASELVDDIAATGMRDVVLVGHSQAGMPMARMSEIAPEMFRRLIYITCSAPAPGTSLLELIGDGRHGDRDDQVGYPLDPATTSFDERFAVMFCNDMTPADREAFLAKLHKDVWPLCSYIYRDWRYDHLDAIPSTYVMCQRDMSLPPAWQQRFADQLRVDRCVQIDAGHQAMNTRPGELAAILLADTTD